VFPSSFKDLFLLPQNFTGLLLSVNTIFLLASESIIFEIASRVLQETCSVFFRLEIEMIWSPFLSLPFEMRDHWGQVQ
jgi:hypothetical protein